MGKKENQLFFLLVILCSSFIFSSFGASKEKVRIGLIELAPLVQKDQKGAPSGFIVNIYKEIAKKEKWDLEFYLGDYKNCSEWLKNKKIDFIGAMDYEEENRRHLDYSSESLISTWAQLYADPDLDIKSLLDISGKRLGYISDGFISSKLDRFFKRFEFSIELEPFTNYQSLFKGINDGKVDIAILDRISSSRLKNNHLDLLTSVVFLPIELKAAALKGQHSKRILEIDYHMKRLKSDLKSDYYKWIKEKLDKKKTQGLPRWGMYVIVICIWLLAMVGIVTLIYRFQVKIKTKELVYKNQRLEDEIFNRSEAEGQLKKSNELLNKIFLSMGDALIIFNGSTGRIQNCNLASSIMFGVNEEVLMAGSIEEIQQNPEKASLFKEVLIKSIQKNGYLRGRFNLKREDNTSFPADVVVTPLIDEEGTDLGNCVMIIRNISEQVEATKALRKSEKRLQQAQKMESIGTLAAGIAHDFNNLLLPITGYTQMLLLDLQAQDDSPHRLYLEKILEAVNRAKGLIDQILSFSKHGPQEKHTFRLTPVANEVSRFLRSSLPNTISIQVISDVNDDYIFADPNQIHQVLMNFCTNAAYSMREKGGTLQIQIANHTGELKGWTDSEDLGDGDFVRLSVKDTGSGISKNMLPKIFDPFFTTKGKGEGTGLGLSAIHGIVRSYGGAVSVETKLRKGSTFHVYLPKKKSFTQFELKESDVIPKGTGEHILYLDDEKMSIEVMNRLLDSLGYRVTSLSMCQEVLDIFKNAPDRFDLLVVDINFPDTSKFQFIREILGHKPDLPIILCTDSSEEVPENIIKELSIRDLVKKPFVLSNLAWCIFRNLGKNGYHISS